MRIEKIINNNIISSFDEYGNELIVMGRGIGFAKKRGDDIADSQIEKIFRVETGDLVSKLEMLLSSIPVVYFEISEVLITYAETNLNMELNQNIYLTLTDHLNFTVQRFKDEIFPSNPFLWELKKFYEKEYSLGLYALELLREKLSVSMTEDEAGFIAMHFINAACHVPINTELNFPNLFKDIVDIVQSELAIDLKESNLCHDQFIQQLKCLVERVYHKDMICLADVVLEQFILQRYEKAYRCADRIIHYIALESNIEIVKDEILYLAIHLQTVLIYRQNKLHKEDNIH